jgi:mannose-6-phosphate isomerase-like protein (cupin superfamily)
MYYDTYNLIKGGIMEIQNPKTVNKPWGNELWIADGVRTPYALKRILFKAGFRSSLQVHQYKFETNYVLSGTGVLQLRSEFFNCKEYLDSSEQSSILANSLHTLRDIQIKPGDVIDVKPGQIHRVIATTDLVFIEASTKELDDVIRLVDDASRGHGKIESEHGN